MEFNQKANEKIEELQILESQMQNFLAQKQTAQIELNEINNALEELDGADGEVYKIVSGILIRSEKKKLDKELKEKKKVLDMRVESMEKQEKLLEKNALGLRKEISKIMAENDKTK